MADYTKQWRVLIQLLGDNEAAIALVSSLVARAIHQHHVPVDRAHDVVQEAVLRALAGTRKWNPDRRNVVEFLTDAVWGVSGNEWRKLLRRQKHEEPGTIFSSSESADDEEFDRVEGYADPDSVDPAQYVEDLQLQQRIFDLLDRYRAKDFEVRLWGRLYFLGCTAEDIEDLMKLSPKDAENIPAGRPKMPPLWPVQNPSPGSGGTRDDYAD